MTDAFVWFIFLSLLVSVPFVMGGHAKPGHGSDDTRSALLFAFQTEKGSALHEAALFGKTDVVHILLAAGEVGALSACMRGRTVPWLPEGLSLAAFEPSVHVSPLWTACASS